MALSSADSKIERGSARILIHIGFAWQSSCASIDSCLCLAEEHAYRATIRAFSQNGR